jgi:hypothetical protein
MQPENLIIDFEIASFVSFKKYFQKTKINTCLFHFTQLSWRKIQSLGFSKLYKSISRFNFTFRLILSLAFVPHIEIFNKSKLLNSYFERENCGNEIFVFFDWFKRKFIYEDTCVVNHKPEIWSVYERCYLKIPRTTNSLEGFHRHLNNNCPKTINH